jgi:hypothetical protein
MSRKIILMALAAGILAASVQAQDGAPAIFVPMTPCRMVDTRVDSSGGAIGATVRNLIVTGAAYSGVPVSKACTAATGAPSNARSIELNFTMANMTGFSDLRVAPWGTAPVDSIMNSIAGQNLAQEATETVATDGVSQEGISVKAGGTSFDLIVDVLGYFTIDFRNGEGLNLTTNSSNWTLTAFNLDTTCGGLCGGYVDTISGDALQGISFDASAGSTTGVFGQTQSTGGGSAGVRGFAADFGGNDTYGVWGQTTSTGVVASGVYGRGAAGAVSHPSNSLRTGVFAESNTESGIWGIGNEYGIVGTSFNGAGVSTSEGALGIFSTALFGNGNLVVTGSKSFVEPHPTDPTKEINFVSLEGPESGTYFRGKGQIVNGFATIDVPESFRLVTDADDLTFVATAVGQMASLAVVSQDLNTIVVQGSRDVGFNYIVNGVRRAFKDHQAIQPNTSFVPPNAHYSRFWMMAPEIQHRLVVNGTYHADGSINMDTARRLGWAQTWAERDARTRAAAQAAQAEAAAKVQADMHKVAPEQQ